MTFSYGPLRQLTALRLIKYKSTSHLADLLLITAAQTESVWNVSIKTAAAQNMVAIGLIENQFQTTITRVGWVVAGAPFSGPLRVAVDFIMTGLI